MIVTNDIAIPLAVAQRLGLGVQENVVLLPATLNGIPVVVACVRAEGGPTSLGAPTYKPLALVGGTERCMKLVESGALQIRTMDEPVRTRPSTTNN